MIAPHGLDSAWFGRRTRNFGSGGNLVGANLVDPPLGAMAIGVGSEDEVVQANSNVGAARQTEDETNLRRR